MESDNQQNPQYTALSQLYDDVQELVHDLEDQERKIEELSKPNWTLAPVWFATCVVSYIYGVTLGLYMCSK